MEKYIYRGKLERVVDGDTIDALIDVGFDIWVKKRIRYKGLDAWESRTRNQFNVNEKLIEEGHAYVYEGGKKKLFEVKK